MSKHPIPIVKHPLAVSERPVIASIPHFGTEPIPNIKPHDYSDPEFTHWPWGYADTFAADVYGKTNEYGAFLIATPYSRLFVDVNRGRNDFVCKDKVVTSTRGVFRTHTRRGRAIFAKELTKERAEYMLSHFYDPYHAGLVQLIEHLKDKHEKILLLDMHTASPNRIGDHEIVIGTHGATTAERSIIDRIINFIAAAGIKVEEDVPGYAGGHIVRHYGIAGTKEVQAIQIEINSGLLMTTPKKEFMRRLLRGERPKIHARNIERIQRCLKAIISQTMA